MLPQPLIEQYWHEVEEILVKQYEHPLQKAARGIGEYRRRLAEHGVGDMVYHAGTQDAAAVVDSGIKHGFPESPPIAAQPK